MPPHNIKKFNIFSDTSHIRIRNRNVDCTANIRFAKDIMISTQCPFIHISPSIRLKVIKVGLPELATHVYANVTAT